MTASFKWSARSKRALEGIDPKLRQVCDLALKLSPIDFIITEGLRSVAQQKKNIAKGVSWTMKSNHLTGRAIDYVALVDGVVTYKEPAMRQIADAFKAASKQLDIPITWGGDWKVGDTPHIELKK